MVGRADDARKRVTSLRAETWLAAVILGFTIMIVLLPIIHPPSQVITTDEGLDVLLGLFDLISYPSLTGIDFTMCDYQEAGRYALEEFTGGAGVGKLVIFADNTVLAIEHSASSRDTLGGGMLIEKRVVGGPLCGGEQGSVGFSFDAGSETLELRLEGGRYELVLPPLNGTLVEIRAADSIMRGKLVDAGSLTMVIESSMVYVAQEIHRTAWRGAELKARDSLVSLTLGGNIDNVSSVGIEASSSIVVLDLSLGRACVAESVLHNSILSADYPPCSEIPGYIGGHVQLTLNARDSMVIEAR